jgi:serine protease inhibitor
MRTFTRLVVLTGFMGLACPPSEAKNPGSAGGSLSEKQAVSAVDTFGVNLYRELAKENPDRNLFFSPYSMSSALIMAAEGARGETAKQMGAVLSFSDDLRRSGGDANEAPWDMSPIHTGMAELNKTLTPKPLAKETKDKIAALRAELAAANAKAEEFEKERKWDAQRSEAMKSQGLARQLNALLIRTDQYELRTANALYGEKTYPFRQKFLDTINRYYGTGRVVPVDFKTQPEAVRGRINAWVGDRTDHRIRELIPSRGVDSATRLVLCNAIYFKGQWAHPFAESATHAEDFLEAGGGKVQVEMMQDYGMGQARYGAFNGDGGAFPTPQTIKRQGEQRALYPGKEGLLVAELPYKGKELSMVVFVPQDAGGLGELERRLTSTNLQSWISHLERRSVYVHLPKFKLETEYQGMKDTLRSMGMVRPFADTRDAKAGAQFGGMCAGDDPRLQLNISKVCHKAFVEVNEKGTEAAAATAVMMVAATARMSAYDEEPFTPTFRADKPFLFAIREVRTGCILFLGRVVHPNAG